MKYKTPEELRVAFVSPLQEKMVTTVHPSPLLAMQVRALWNAMFAVYKRVDLLNKLVEGRADTLPEKNEEAVPVDYDRAAEQWDMTLE